MTDHIPSAADDRFDDMSDDLLDPATAAQAADLELIISALNGHLSPERVADVTRRLEEDPAFRDLAAPMLLTWSIPSYLERHPRPVGELEQAWTEFAERAGITPPPAPPPRRWHSIWRRTRMLFLIALLLPLTPFVTYGLMWAMPLGFWEWIGQKQEDVLVGPSGDEPMTFRVHSAATSDGSRDAASDTSWNYIQYGVHVRPEAGAIVTWSERKRNGRWQLTLDSGTVRVRLMPLTRADPSLRRATVDVVTRAGVIIAGESEFTVSATGDTTTVEMHSAGRPSTTGHTLQPVSAVVSVGIGGPSSQQRRTYHVPLGEGDRTRIVREQVPDRFRDHP